MHDFIIQTSRKIQRETYECREQDKSDHKTPFMVNHRSKTRLDKKKKLLTNMYIISKRAKESYRYINMCKIERKWN